MINVSRKITLLGCFIWLLAALFYSYEYFLRTFVGTFAQQVISDLHLDAETFSLLGTAYFITYGIMQIPVGLLCDKFGAKKIMVFATLVCALASFLFANSTGFETAFISRALMGFGSSFAFVCLLVITLNWFPRQYFGFFAGASQFVGIMGPILAAGPLMTLMMAIHESWQSVLSQIGSFGIGLSLLIFLFVKNNPPRTEREFIQLERQEKITKRLKRLIKNRQAWFIGLYSGLVNVAIFLLGAIWGTDYLEGKGLSQIYSAYIISITWIGYALGCPALGLLSDIMKRRKPVLAFSAGLGFTTMCFILFWQTANFWLFVVVFFFLGIAGAGQSVGFVIISEHVAPKIKSTALGFNNSIMIFFLALIPAVTGWIIELSAQPHTPQISVQSFFWAFLILPIFYLIALTISLFGIKETYCRPQKEVMFIR